MANRIPAVYMRGGTSKGVFLLKAHLPENCLARDRLLLRVIGSPDPYGKQTDGMGGATSSTSKIVVISPSQREDCDVEFLFGQVSIEKPVIDWSGNCGNLSAAVGPFAIAQQLVQAPTDGTALVRIWQANLQARIHAHVPMANGKVVEEGDFLLDGVAFPGAEILLDFFDQAEGDESGATGLFPTGNLRTELRVPGIGEFEVTLISAGNPTIFIRADDIGLRGDELQADVNGDASLLARCEVIRAHASVVMGLAKTANESTNEQPHTPKLAFVSKPMAYVASSGKPVGVEDIDLNVRILSMGKLHHAMTGTGAVAVGVAAAIPGTVVNNVIGNPRGDSPGTKVRSSVRFGHPSGVTVVSTEAEQHRGVWHMTRVSLSRTARTLMEGWVCVPQEFTR